MDPMGDNLNAINQKLLNELTFERQLNQILDVFRDYSLLLINGCKCDINREIVHKLNQLSDDYACLRSGKVEEHNASSLSSDPEIDDKSGDTSEEVFRPQIELKESTDPYIPDNCLLTCHQCQQQFASELDLQIHTNSVHKTEDGLQLYTCDECREVFTSEDMFDVHMRDNHGFDETNTTDNSEDDGDITDKNNGSYLSENLSLKSLQSVEKMLKSCKNLDLPKRWPKSCHSKSHSTNATKNYTNDFLRKYLVENVPNYGRIVNKFQCNECHKLMPSETALEIHLNKYHKNLKPFVCVICADAFFANLSLLNHLSQKHRICAFECDSCDYKTRTKHHLIQHKISHSMDKPFKCHFLGCNKSFKRKFRLMNHKILHFNQFMCQECNEDFKDNATLLSHLSHKHKQSVFECNACDYKTRNRHHLIRHEIIHSTDRPFVCRYDGCNFTFKRKDYLLRHEKLH
ncbi:unnamed protein product [Medioppia subpectinata]|uniref:C2H2-type domain-containing protein n=1 Tax=Medioppia subpectinata TaxID=1979941 RepID=A0A7R9KQY6_9ACAR|nr:unnamed protein product [Medioppia subpectinata]CAG2107934.1 unnamed protein product [Medioppia subpectinata]